MPCSGGNALVPFLSTLRNLRRIFPAGGGLGFASMGGGLLLRPAASLFAETIELPNKCLLQGIVR